jgi:hypothetical protein
VRFYHPSLQTLFSALTETVPHQLRKHFATLQQIFYRGLSDADKKVRVQSLHALSSLTNLADEDVDLLRTFCTSVVPLVHLLQQHQQEEETLLAGFDLLENWAISDKAIVAEHVPMLCEMSMALMSSNTNVSMDVRNKVFTLVSTLLSTKAVADVDAAILPRLVSMIQHTALALISTADDDDDGSEDEDSEDETTDLEDGTHRPVLTEVQQLGVELLDEVLTNVPSTLTYSFMRQVVTNALDISRRINQVPLERRTAYLVLAVMVDGCSKELEAEGGGLFAPQLICQGIQDTDASVRYAACIAMNDMARHLPNVTIAHVHTLLPVVFHALMAPQEELKTRRQCCFNLSTICAQLDKTQLAPFLTPIMQQVRRGNMCYALASANPFPPFTPQVMLLAARAALNS